MAPARVRSPGGFSFLGKVVRKEVPAALLHQQQTLRLSPRAPQERFATKCSGASMTVASSRPQAASLRAPHRQRRYGQAPSLVRKRPCSGPHLPAGPWSPSPQESPARHGETARRSGAAVSSKTKPFSLYVFNRKCVAVESTPSIVLSFSETKRATSRRSLPSTTTIRS